MTVRKFHVEGFIDSDNGRARQEQIQEIIIKSQQENSDGYNIDTLRSLTDAITQYYRKNGYFLASAYIPEQTIKDDTVLIQVLEGVLTEIAPENNKLYSDNRLIKSLSPLLSFPANQKKIETAMLHLNDYPGVNATAIFSPGEKLGTTLLTINTVKENKYQGSLGLDNFGNEFTGQYKLRGNFTANNVLGFADRFTFNAVQTFSPTNSTYNSINYTIPVWKSGLSLGFSYSNNAYAVGDIFTDLGIDGSSDLFALHGRYHIKRSKKSNIYTRFDLTKKSAISSGGGDSFKTEDESTVLSSSIGMDGDDTWFFGKHAGELTLSQGLTAVDMSIGNTTPITDNDFTKLNLHYTHSLPLESKKNQYLIASTRVQYSANVLNALEQMSLGGPQNIRAFTVSKYLVDSGIIFNLEWFVRTLPSEDLGWTRNVQFSAYFDYAIGHLNSSDDNPRILTSEGNSVTLKGLGLGLRLTPSKGYQLRIDLAFPIGKPEPNDDSSLQFLFNFGYQF